MQRHLVLLSAQKWHNTEHYWFDLLRPPRACMDCLDFCNLGRHSGIPHVCRCTPPAWKPPPTARSVLPLLCAYQGPAKANGFSVPMDAQTMFISTTQRRLRGHLGCFNLEIEMLARFRF